MSNWVGPFEYTVTDIVMQLPERVYFPKPV